MKLDRKRLKIGSFSARIWADAAAEEAMTAAGAQGTWLGDQLVVVVDRRLAPLRQISTIFHESMHAIWEESPLDKVYSDEQEEAIILVLERGILQFLRDNPWFVTRMMETE